MEPFGGLFFGRSGLALGNKLPNFFNSLFPRLFYGFACLLKGLPGGLKSCADRPGRRFRRAFYRRFARFLSSLHGMGSRFHRALGR